MTDQQRKDLAESYRLMMESAAWKHFMNNILYPIGDRATKDEDAIDLLTMDKSIGLLGECRGRRNAIRKIQSDLAFLLEAHSVKA